MAVKAKSARKEEKRDEPIKRILISAAAGSAVYFIIIALFAFFALKNGTQGSLYMPAGMVMGAISGFLSGFTAVRPVKEKGVPYGTLTGFIQSVINSIVLFVANKGSAGTGLFILAAIVIIMAAIGGVSAVNLKIKKKY